MSVYWPVGLIQGHLAVRGYVGFNGKVPIGELWKDFGHKGLVRLSEDKYLLGQAGQRSEGLVYHQELRSDDSTNKDKD